MGQESKVLKVGDQVWWRGGFGEEPSRLATVIRIELHCYKRKGDEVAEVEWARVRDSVRGIIVDLDNQHWAYGNQLSPINGKEKGK